jgi:adenylyltransferase/sulfurtransferase
MVPQIDVQQLAARLQAGEPVFLLDVRQPWEHETAALPGSHLLPLDQLPAGAAELEVPADALLVVYCHHGIRSQSAVVLLQCLGHDRAVSLAGGIDAWSRLVDPHVPRY